MGKALVIPYANFATNKLDTIDIADDVPCTGISLSADTLSFTSLTSQTLTPTLTPSNTTDLVSWQSSDPTVATVADGVVTAVGLGTATITARCGSHSAICTVSVSVTMTENDFVGIINGNQTVSKTQFESGLDYIKLSHVATNKQVLLASAVPTKSGYKAFTGNTEEIADKYPVMIPKNSSQVTVTSSVPLSGVSMAYLDSTEQPTYEIADKGAKLVDNPGTSWGGSPKQITFPTNVNGLDSFVATLAFSSAIDAIPSFTFAFA